MEKTTLKLWEAAKLGSLIRPKAMGFFYRVKTKGSCFLGAAAEAVGCDITSNIDDLMHVQNCLDFNWGDFLSLPVPVIFVTKYAKYIVGSNSITIRSFLACLNDYSAMSREEIADIAEEINCYLEKQREEKSICGGQTQITMTNSDLLLGK